MLAVEKGANLFIQGVTWRGFYSPDDIDTSTPFSRIAKYPVLIMELRSMMRDFMFDFFEDLTYTEEEVCFSLRRIASHPDMLREIISFI